jgi:lipopolysaccharide/colanic/teichoic acid biosynthesis glycosyltransferase
MDQLRRTFDIVAALVGLVVFFPVLVLIALWIRLDSPGRIFFRQPRVGKNGREFAIYKFRSMYDQRYSSPPTVPPPRTSEEAKFRKDFCCETCARPVEECGCVTRAGRLLRKTGLDELPQLLNVIRGDMTFVGPRPTLRYQVEQYSQRERRRLQVRPGITGLAQVSGRNEITWEKKIELDLWYVENRGLWLDCKIVLWTLLQGSRWRSEHL